MSKRKFAVTPVQPLVLEFPNGDTMEAIFTIDTMMMISEKFGDLTIVSEEYKHKPYDLATKLLYCGLIVMGNEVTYEEVQAIVIGGGLPLLAVIFESVAETFEGLDNIEDLSALDMTKLEDIKKKAMTMMENRKI